MNLKNLTNIFFSLSFLFLFNYSNIKKLDHVNDNKLVAENKFKIIKKLKFSPNGNLLALSILESDPTKNYYSNYVKVIDIKNNSSSIFEHLNNNSLLEAQDMNFSSDNKKLAIAWGFYEAGFSYSGEINLWDISTYKRILLKGDCAKDDVFQNVSFNSDGSKLIASTFSSNKDYSFQSDTLICDSISGEFLKNFKNNSNSFFIENNNIFSIESKFLGYPKISSIIKIRNLPDYKEIFSKKSGANEIFEENFYFKVDKNNLTYFNDAVVGILNTKNIKKIKTTKHKKIKEINNDISKVYDISKEGFLLTETKGFNLALFNSDSNKKLAEKSLAYFSKFAKITSTYNVESCKFIDNSSVMIIFNSVSKNKKMAIWNIKTNQLDTIIPQNETYSFLDLNSNGKEIVTGNENEVKFWDIKAKRFIKEIKI